ncbi:unnamed protein product [Oppiella nova]|uniref:Uncharacterized protein n=1 Tax=Oppiella nova TaxID=334625 RepID=A0A7R9LUM0_9ACAR|nr:unnamed protein product [Oppiella nova]CAG2167134.1 unnamed protein product [Oppiella nova]
MDQLSSVLNNISNDELVTMEREAKDYALSQGIGFKLKTNPLDTISMAPITLFPSPLGFLVKVWPFAEVGH